MKRTDKKGFTLVELVVVIAVLLILAAIAIPVVTGIISRANESADTSNAQAMEAAIKYAVAYNTTSPETEIDKVKDALVASGMEPSLDAKQGDGYLFWLHVGVAGVGAVSAVEPTLRVICAKTSPGTGYTQLSLTQSINALLNPGGQ